ncbi:MAG: DNA mismatch repair endonuclease MutL [Armatimonadetes bacterium]|nr:DNA mismatch repair endonuclease MutL [Armatimonadota bacterium]
MSETGPRIHVLEPVVANQIAAGEVVERPASVVKELVENSRDAGSTRIEVSVEDGGRKLLRVRDNGHGMGDQDAVLCLQRHATSKIRTADDLRNIRSLGFRGEALPSIASVSQMTLITREEGRPAGVQMLVEGGVVREFNAVGCPVGTDIAVRDLFFNTPARLKFLKTAATELEHILAHMTAFSLLHHDVAFRLEHNGREVLSAPACSDLKNALVTVYGADLAREMIPVELDAGTLFIRGAIGKPALARGTRSHQWFFVNGRPVRNRTLSHALYDGYHTLLMSGRHPVCVVVIELDPSSVDVNVHPAKSEVRFAREWEVHNLLRRAVREALEAAQLLGSGEAMPSLRPTPPGTLADSPAPAEPGEPAVAPAESLPVQGTLFDDPDLPARPTERFPLRIRALGQVGNSYIACDTEEGLLLIDQHALHERVLYEQLTEEEAHRGRDRQLLAVPLTLDFSPREATAVQSNLDNLAVLGFELEPFGRETFLLRSVPAVLAHRKHEQVLRDVVDDLVAQGSGARGFEHHRDFVLRTMACKAAVKAGDVLAPEEIEELLRLMHGCEIPFHCNHGRPTMFTISLDALERRFGRT